LILSPPLFCPALLVGESEGVTGEDAVRKDVGVFEKVLVVLEDAVKRKRVELDDGDTLICEEKVFTPVTLLDEVDVKRGETELYIERKAVQEEEAVSMRGENVATGVVVIDAHCVVVGESK